MSDRIQLRGSTAAFNADVNEILADKEICIETDTLRLKIGDGVTNYNDLPYFGSAVQATGAVNFSAIATPSPPSSGLDVFARETGGRTVLAMQGSGGVDTSLQPALWGNRIYILSPGTSTSMTVIGGPTHTAVGTVSHPVLVATDFLSSVSHAQILSAATASAVAHSRVPFTSVWRGDNPGYGGWFSRQRFGFKALPATNKGMFGLIGTSGVIAGTVVPSATLNTAVAGWDEGETEFSMMFNGPSGTATKIATGITPTVGHVYEVTTRCVPNGDEITWQLDDITPGSTASVSGTFTDTLKMPVSTTFLAPHLWLGNGATAAAATLALLRVYLEADI